MFHTKKFVLTGIGGVTAVLAIALGLLAAAPSSVDAQDPDAWVGFGTGIEEGDDVVALIGGVDCSSATADAGGAWELAIEADATCSPTDGVLITFELNGEAANETATWSEGGTPVDDGYDPVLGIVLTVGDNGTPTPTPTPTPTATPTTPPTPPDTGNAGLVGSGSGSGFAAMLLVALTASMVAGVWIVTRTR